MYETTSLVTAVCPGYGIPLCHSCLDFVHVKIVCIKSIVNKLSCPKCQGEFLKVCVANVADMLNVLIASRLMSSIHDTYFMHTCVCMLCFNYGLRNMFY